MLAVRGWASGARKGAQQLVAHPRCALVRGCRGEQELGCEMRERACHGGFRGCHG